MATIRQLPSGKYNAIIRVKGCPTKTITRDTREEVEQLAREYEQGLKSPKTTNTVESLSDSYLQEVMVKDGKERGGYEATKFRLVTIGRALKGKHLESLTKEDVLNLKSVRLTEISGSTVRLELQLLSRFLRWAKEEHSVQCSDVTEGVKLPEAGKARSKVVEPVELKMILDRAPDAAKDFFVLAYETAMRRNELLAVTPSMIDLKKRIITLSDDMVKNGCGREVPLTKKAVEVLHRLCDGKDKEQRIFLYSPYGITQAFRRAARLAGITNTH